MVLFIKKIINFFRPDLQIFSKKALTHFNDNNEDYKLYLNAILKTKNLKSNNFFKEIRFLNLLQLIRYSLTKSETFDFAECGCWHGHSSFIISKLIHESSKNIEFHIFDSFEGLSPETKEDKNFSNLSKQQREKQSKLFASSEDFLKNNVLKDFNFFKTYKGWIPTRFNEVKEKKFSFVHIDVDLYEPTFQSLEFFYPRLVNGGVIVCDDYNYNEFDGAKKAWDTYFADKEYFINHKNPMGGSFLIK
jgi:O-methyltransferase